MPKVKVVTRKAKPYVLHEFNSKGQHRLVLVEEAGNKVSRWFESHQTGSFEGLLFVANWGESLKPGVFRQSMVEARVVPDSGHLIGTEAQLAKAGSATRSGRI